MSKLCGKKRILNRLFDDERYAPFFIIGSGRSGNTLLRRMLMDHGDVYIPPETYVLGNIISDYKKYSKLEWSAICKIVLFSFSSSEDFEGFPTLLLRDLYVKLYGADENKRTLAFILNSFYEYMALHAGRRDVKWGDKTPQNVYCLHEIDGVFPDAKYIHIIRDGCDVVPSYLEMGRYTNLEDAASRWTSSIDLCRDFGVDRPDRYMEIRYEDLVQSPESVLADVCCFLNIRLMYGETQEQSINDLGDVNIHKHHENVKNTINTSSIGKGRKKMSGSEREMLRQLIGVKLLELGYELP